MGSDYSSTVYEGNKEKTESSNIPCNKNIMMHGSRLDIWSLYLHIQLSLNSTALLNKISCFSLWTFNRSAK